MNEFKIPYNVFIDKEYLVKYMNKKEDLDLVQELAVVKDIAINEREASKCLYIVIEHSFNSNCFIVLSYDYLMSIKNGNLKIYTANQKSAGIVIGKQGRNVNYLKNTINRRLADFNGFEPDGYPKRRIRNFTILDIDKEVNKKVCSNGKV